MATLVFVLVATLGSCYSEPERAPREPWNCSTSKDVFGEAFHACKAEGQRLLDPVFSLTVFCTTQEGSLPDDLSTGNISHRFSASISGREIRLFARSKVEVSFDDGPVTEWQARPRSGSFGLVNPDLRSDTRYGTIIHELVNINPEIIAIRVVDDDGFRQSGQIRLGGMETALSYLESRGCDRNALI